MTVETSDRKVTFLGGQNNLAFSFRTLVSNPEYIKVKKVSVATGDETDLSYGIDYTVSVNSTGIGGTVVLTPTFSTSFNALVYRDTSPLQTSDYDDFNQFPADTLENSVDKAILIAQEIKEETDRTLRYPISASGADTELPAPEAGAFIGWNAAGDALENKDLPDPSLLQKATNGEATAGTNDTHYMTPAKVKLQVENSGSVAIPAANITGLPTVSTATIVNAAYPVGSIYISTVATNPGTLLGTGTWTAFGTGRMLVGFDGGDPSFNTVEGTGGAKTKDLSHTHTFTTGGVNFGGATGSNTAGALDTKHYHTGTTDTGGSASQDILNPYIVVYMWKRTA